MYPTLSHLVKDLFGIDTSLTVNTYTFFFLLATLASYFILRKELRRKVFLNLISGTYNKNGTYRDPEEQSFFIVFLALFFGFIGARLFAIIKYSEPIGDAPMNVLFSLNNLSFYGGFIFGAVAVLIYANRIGLHKYHLLDAIAPALMMAYAIGRLGCYLSGNGNWGVTNSHPKPQWLSFLPDPVWAYNYPHNLVRQGITMPECTDKYCKVLPDPVFPTSLYEFLICTLAFILIWLLRKKFFSPGFLFSVYLLLVGIERYIIAQIKIDAKLNLFKYKIEYVEFISVLIIFTGLLMLLLRIKRGNLLTRPRFRS